MLPQPACAGLTVSLEILDTAVSFSLAWRAQSGRQARAFGDSRQNSVSSPCRIDWRSISSFLLAELKQADGKVVSRSVYWPRCLKLMADPEFRKKYRASPQPSLTFEHGPWLRKEVAESKTNLELQLVSRRDEEKNQSRLQVRVRNAGPHPAFYTEVNIEGTKRTFYAADNGFWLAPKEERLIDIGVLWRDPGTRNRALLTIGAWNAETKSAAIR